jgi:hypothetical protein
MISLTCIEHLLFDLRTAPVQDMCNPGADRSSTIASSRLTEQVEAQHFARGAGTFFQREYPYTTHHAMR